MVCWATHWLAGICHQVLPERYRTSVCPNPGCSVNTRAAGIQNSRGSCSDSEWAPNYWGTTPSGWAFPILIFGDPKLVNVPYLGFIRDLHDTFSRKIRGRQKAANGTDGKWRWFNGKLKRKTVRHDRYSPSLKAAAQWTKSSMSC